VPPSARHWLAGLALVAMLCVVAIVAAAIVWLPRTAHMRERAIAALTNDLESEVELESLETSLRPNPRIVLQNLAVRHKGRHDVPPLIQIRALTVDVSLSGWRAHRLDQVNIAGLRIFIPPRARESGKPVSDGTTVKTTTPETTTTSITTRGPAADWFIDHLTANDTTLLLGVREPGILPREFHIHRLAMSSVGPDRVMTFDAALSNPRPAGEIETVGTFGPWQKDTPSLTPLKATYTFSHADLATFKGIGGILTSEGAFGGILERIDAAGTTTTPDFRLSIGGNTVPLTTRFKAVIDGTNGNTVLTRIDAVLGQTQMAVSGAVIGVRGVEGRTVTVAANIPNGRLEDLLRLVVKGKTPPLRGGIQVKTKMRLPPGDRDVVDKLQLDGEFHIMSARFDNLDIQSKIESLSRRGRGQPQEEGTGRTVSDVAGPFTMKNTVMTLPRLTFGVPGAAVRLSGRYHLRRETLDFLGTVRLQATVSQTMTGVKRFFLKPIDPLFRRDGAGTVLPIRIGGTRGDPAFGLDVKSALRRRDPS
jgi:hypothetical protein